MVTIVETLKREIIELILNNPKTDGYTAAEVAQRLNSDPNYTRTTMKNLTEKGKLQRHCFLINNKKTAKFFLPSQSNIVWFGMSHPIDVSIVSRCS
tara:strand:- start:85 stop:372 length:288 start_codon:yes stop_codon:yes gene_type:complete